MRLTTESQLVKILELRQVKLAYSGEVCMSRNGAKTKLEEIFRVFDREPCHFKNHLKHFYSTLPKDYVFLFPMKTNKDLKVN